MGHNGKGRADAQDTSIKGKLSVSFTTTTHSQVLVLLVSSWETESEIPQVTQRYSNKLFKCNLAQADNLHYGRGAKVSHFHPTAVQRFTAKSKPGLIKMAVNQDSPRKQHIHFPRTR